VLRVEVLGMGCVAGRTGRVGGLDERDERLCEALKTQTEVLVVRLSLVLRRVQRETHDV